jgi:ABC-type glycerol-3-phosphate transport system substrate-binding protein
MLKKTALAAALSLLAVTLNTPAQADCAFENTTPVKMLAAGFEAWKAVSSAMEECGNFTAELDQEFRTKQPAAFAANPALYQIGGVSNGTVTPLYNEGTIRPLDDLVEKYGQNLKPNQLIKIDGKVMAIAMMVNTQHLQYRADIFKDLGLEVPTTWDQVLTAAEAIKQAGVVEYPLGATMKAGWNLGQDFNNMFLGFGGKFTHDDNTPAVNSEAGLKALETMQRMTDYLHPEYLTADSTFVQQQFQQNKIAMANFWASRSNAADDSNESQVVGKVETASAPLAMEGGKPATTLWWDGIVIAKNISDEDAEAAFKVAMEGLDSETVKANNDVAIWLIEGYQPGRLAQGAIATAMGGPSAYPSTTQMGLMHTALGNNLPDFFTGAKSAEETLQSVEEAYLTSAKEAGLL